MGLDEGQTRGDCDWNRERLVPVREAGRSDVGEG